MRLPILAAGLLLAGSLAAQSYTVSPAAYALFEGPSNNTFPLWWTNARYQQIHGDMKGSPKALKGMEFRRSNINSGVARSITVTINVGDSSYAAASSTFASNFIGTPTNVLPKTTISLPNWAGNTDSPQPWNALFPFTTPFPYTAVNDLVWEFLVEGNTATSVYPADAYSSGDRMNGGRVTLGTGCKVGANTLPMTQTINLYSLKAAATLNFNASIVRGPASASAVLMVGPVNPDLTIPGLCEKLFTISMWDFPITLSASGSGSSALLTIPHNLAWAGLKVFSQTAALDAGQPGIPVALSNGTESTIPAFHPGLIDICRIYNSTSSTALTGSLGLRYGLITRFVH
jgi:hypothetical protein